MLWRKEAGFKKGEMGVCERQRLSLDRQIETREHSLVPRVGATGWLVEAE